MLHSVISGNSVIRASRKRWGGAGRTSGADEGGKRGVSQQTATQVKSKPQTLGHQMPMNV